MQVMNNPYLEECPDFSGDAYQAQRQRLVAAGMSETDAIDFLKSSWTAVNDEAKERWDQLRHEHQLAEAEEARLAGEAQALKEAAEREERDAQVAEDRKKNRAKFIPVEVGAKMPNIDPIYFTAAYMAKLRKGEYQELWLTTPQGMRYLLKSLGTSTAPQAWSLSTGEDGQVKVVASDELKLSNVLVRDEDLSWEDFLSALILLIKAMKEAEWPQDRIEMFSRLAGNIQSHPYATSLDTTGCDKRALIIYVARQRRAWHTMALREQSLPDLSILDETALARAWEEAFRMFRQTNFRQVRVVLLLSLGTY
ncbi:hypothetical protein FA13DRAFT_1483343 [Coprinellus micaceus]|jgi:hypothetical protein|uniref:Uncharacterized protein n=1 Tax=Coprinellus micaceus TaxID=71717 RepID=A0A4Y7SA41_COPMI|nr:hypothetical protein FA13DRAFT_1803565 [Coprinellus micaceus]TEB34480.1 hypothetical protein FA13DRAFT_1483343 [Coprinellus micaceus]